MQCIPEEDGKQGRSAGSQGVAGGDHGELGRAEVRPGVVSQGEQLLGNQLVVDVLCGLDHALGNITLMKIINVTHE